MSKINTYNLFDRASRLLYTYDRFIKNEQHILSLIKDSKLVVLFGIGDRRIIEHLGVLNKKVFSKVFENGEIIAVFYDDSLNIQETETLIESKSYTANSGSKYTITGNNSSNVLSIKLNEEHINFKHMYTSGFLFNTSNMVVNVNGETTYIVSN